MDIAGLVVVVGGVPVSSRTANAAVRHLRVPISLAVPQGYHALTDYS